MKWQKYSAYKNSGVEWLGEIPENWGVRKLKYLFHIGRGRVISQEELDDDGIYPVYSSQTKNNGILGYIKTFDFDCKQITWTTDGANAGTVFLREGKHNCTNVCGTLQQKRNDEIIEFLNYSLQITAKFYKRPDTNGAKIMNNEMAEILVTYPPKQEQIKIANYLDQKTAQIDKAISLKEQMIERLGEQRQILINDAVTKGLDKTVKMKDSGVEWIGRIPKHWEVEKGKRLFRQMKRPIKDEDEIITCFRDGEVTLRKNRRTDGFTNALKEHGYQGIRKGDLVIHNMDAFAGAIGISDSNGKSTPVYSVCIPWNEDLTLPEYYAYYLRHLAVQGFILSLAKGIRERSTDFRFNDFGELLFPVPPKVEQKEIMSYVNSITQKTQRVIALYQQQIEKLKEYKATLIDSVVTGKVRVV